MLLIRIVDSFVKMFREVMDLTTTRWEREWRSWRRTSNLLKVFIWSRFGFNS